MRRFAFKQVGRLEKFRSSKFGPYGRVALQSRLTRPVDFKNESKFYFRGCYVLFSGTTGRISIIFGSKEAESCLLCVEYHVSLIKCLKSYGDGCLSSWGPTHN